jgi:iron only hydrogenase large subunit-like protein
MVELTYCFTIDHEKCKGKMACMRACPTQAIRVKGGKASVLPDLCIDCGACLRACPTRAISATTHALKDLEKFKFKVAIPSPALFGQFPADITPGDIVEGLKAIGFDEVWITAVEIEVVNRAIRDYMAAWDGRLPLISSSCPAIVRLIQVAYPGMVEQLVHLQTPRELACRELKRRYSKELGISREEIGAVYLSGCQAKSVSIPEPAEGVKSELDMAIGISDVYNGILAAAHSQKGKNNRKPSAKDIIRNGEMFLWAMSKSQRWNLSNYRYMLVNGLSNVIRAFDDIEKGKLRNLDFLEAYACLGGCVNGNLTVENLYVTRDTLRRLMAELKGVDERFEEEVRERYVREHLHLEAPVHPRSIRGDKGDLKERIKRLKQAEAVLSKLPGINCGLCGTPGCSTLAKDIAAGDAQISECIFYSKDHLEKLRAMYQTGMANNPLQHLSDLPQAHV